MAANTVAFKLGDVFGGLGIGDGLLHDEGTHIRMEYQLKDNLLGVLKSGVREVRLPLADLASVTLTKGWFGMKRTGVKIVIQARRMDVLQDVPGASQGRVELHISRKDYNQADKFVADLHEAEGDASGFDQGH